MSAVAVAFDFGEGECEPRSGIMRTGSIVVVEAADDLSGALLEACGEPIPVLRFMTLRLVARRGARLAT